MAKKVVHTENARDEDYRAILNEINTEGKCPFCPDNFKYHKKPVLKTEGNWFITENFKPYQNAAHHFLIIGFKHKEHFSELTATDFKEVQKLVNWATETFGISGAALTVRFGAGEYTGASVCHLHFHLISPIKKDGKVQPVHFPIG